MLSVALLLIGVHLAFAGTHTYQYFYTATSGLPTFPEFVAVGMLNGKQINYYDSSTMEAVLKVDWLKSIVNTNELRDIWRGSQQWYKSNLPILKDRFNQSSDAGVHTFQRMYGCEWNDETQETSGLNGFGYDGEDFLSLDLKELRYISPVQQALPSVLKWNNDKGLIENNRQYFGTQCIEWLKKYLQYGENSLKKTVSPEVSLLQKDSSSPVLCHASGFYPSGVKISWLKNGDDHYEDVDIGELLPNVDGTFQKTSSLKTKPDEWKKNEYSCVVEHQGKTINSILTEKDIRTNNGGFPIGLIVGVVAAVILLAVIGAIGYMVYQKKGKSGFVPANTSDGGSNNSSQAPA